ncbi:MAG: ferritin-like domain-containing protein [Nocardioidaceae bacterium]
MGVLNFALTLEYLEADFYARGLRCGILSGRERALVEPIGDHEVQHVAGLKELIESMGADPVDKPAFRYPFLTFRSSSSFLRQARKFEELGVHAYHGQVPLISDPEVLAAAASIAGVESRHAAILDKLTWNDPFPAPIEKPYKKTRVLSEVDPYIVDAGSKREEAGR